MKRRTVDVNERIRSSHPEVRLADRRAIGFRTHRDLLLHLDTVFLKQTQELQFQGGADTGIVGIEPRSRIGDITQLRGDGLGSAQGQAFQVRQDSRPREMFMVALIGIRLQATVAGRLAFRVIEMLNGPSGYEV